MRRWCAFSARRPLLTLLITGIVTLLAALPIGGLRIDSDVLAMLPSDLPAGQSFRTVNQAFGAAHAFVIVIQGADTTALSPAQRDAAHEVAEGIQQHLQALRFADGPAFSTVDGAVSAGERQRRLQAIMPLTPLLMSADELDTVIARLNPQRVAHRLRRGPPPGSPAEWAASDPLGLWSSTYAGFWRQRANRNQQDRGLLLSATGNAYLLLAWPTHPPQHAPYSLWISEQVNHLIDSLQTTTDSHGLSVDWAAGHRLAANDFMAAKHSALFMTVGSMVGIITLFALIFASLRLLLVVGCLLIPALAAGVGLGGWLLGGQLSMVVIAFAAILAGLGVDLIVHGYAAWRRHFSALCHRYQPTTLLGQRALRRRAVLSALPQVSPALVVATITTASAFLVLVAGQFRGIAQLGLISAVGLSVLTILILAALPALLSLAAPLSLPRERGLHILSYCYHWGLRPPLLLFLLMVLALVTWALSVSEPFPITPDARSLRPRHDPLMEHQQRLLDHIGRTGRREVLLIEAATAHHALDELSHLQHQVAQLSPGMVLAQDTLFSLWPSAAQRQATLNRLRTAVDWDALLALEAAFPDHSPFFTQLRQLDDRINSGGLRFQDLQAGPWGPILNRLLHRNDAGRWLGRLDIPLSESASIPDLARDLGLDPLRGDGAGGKDPSTRIALAGDQALSYYLHQALAQEMRLLAGLALVVTALVLFIGLRQWLTSLTAMFILLCSLASTMALVQLCGLTWNMMTIAVLPLVVGIGIDDVVHFGHHLRHLQQRESSLSRLQVVQRSCREVGPAIFLTSLTTAVGFASLLLADYRGLQDMGLIALIGIACCLGCTLLALPLLARATQPHPTKPAIAPPLRR